MKKIFIFSFFMLFFLSLFFIFLKVIRLNGKSSDLIINTESYKGIKNKERTQTPKPPDTENDHFQESPFQKMNNENDKIVTINDKSYVWLNNLYAVKTPKDSHFSYNGFEFFPVSDKKVPFGVFNENHLFVLSDRSRLEDKIITGTIIVELYKIESSRSLANKYRLKIAYEAPQIKTVVFRVQEGDNFIQKLNQIKSSPEVKTADLELLGRGVEIR